jgi:molybdopterin-containing oxidoreductase family membrane subunit
MSDKYLPLLIIMLLGNTIVPLTCLVWRRVRRSIPALLVISLLINVAMFIERFLIIVPSLSHKNVPFMWGSYTPSLVESTVMAAAFSGFALLYMLFAKFFPIVAITDVREETEALRGEITRGRTRLTTLVDEE